MKYKKKPVVIDAVQWTGENHREMFDFLTENAFDKESMQVSGEHFYIDHNKVEGGLIIKTLEGEHLASIGDFIIRGVKGEYYPCKPDVFEQTYEKVEDIPIWTSNEWWFRVVVQVSEQSGFNILSPVLCCYNNINHRYNLTRGYYL